MWRRSLLAPLMGLLVLCVCVVSPRGDFPLNDDWVYGKCVQGLLEHHRYTGHPFTAASVVAQALWGAAFAQAFGFSFTVLRISTLVLALTTTWATACCARELGLSRRSALLCGLLVLGNPIFLNLSYTFMSDVPFMAAGSLSGLFYLRALRQGRVSDVFLGTVFAVVAFGVRQFGVFLTLAFAATVAVEWLYRRKRPPLAHIAACLAPWAVCLAALLYGRLTGDTSYPWTVIMRDVPLVFRFVLTIRYAFIAMLYFGLFLLPLSCARFLLLATRNERWGRGRWASFWACALLIDVVACLIWKSPMPILPNVLRDIGTGPLTLRDSYLLHPGTSLVSIGAWWWPITVISIASASLLVTDLLYCIVPAILDKVPDVTAHPENRPRASQTLFLLLWALFLTAAPHNPFLPVMFDRYLLSPLVPLCLLFAGQLPLGKHRLAPLFVAAPCLLLLLFSLICVQDYMAWNRARWAAIDELITVHGADPLQIDGGFEYNGMHTSDEFMARNETTDFNEAGGLGWWILDDTYAVSFLPRDGYDEIGHVSYFSYLGMKVRRVRMLHRSAHSSETPQDTGVIASLRRSPRLPSSPDLPGSRRDRAR